MSKPITSPVKSAVDEANDCLRDIFEPGPEAIVAKSASAPFAERPTQVRAPAPMDRKHASH